MIYIIKKYEEGRGVPYSCSRSYFIVEWGDLPKLPALFNPLLYRLERRTPQGLFTCLHHTIPHVFRADLDHTGYKSETILYYIPKYNMVSIHNGGVSYLQFPGFSQWYLWGTTAALNAVYKNLPHQELYPTLKEIIAGMETKDRFCFPIINPAVPDDQPYIVHSHVPYPMPLTI